MSKQFVGAPIEAKVAATCTSATTLQEIRVEPDAVQEVAELCVGCIHDFTLAIEKCICMDLDGFVRADVLEEPFELNGFRQVIVLLGDAADEESIRLISGLDFYLGKENCYRDHLLNNIRKSDYRKCCFITEFVVLYLCELVITFHWR